MDIMIKQKRWTGMQQESGFQPVQVSPFDRVRKETAPYVNERIDRFTEGSISYYSG